MSVSICGPNYCTTCCHGWLYWDGNQCVCVSVSCEVENNLSIHACPSLMTAKTSRLLGYDSCGLFYRGTSCLHEEVRGSLRCCVASSRERDVGNFFYKYIFIGSIYRNKLISTEPPLCAYCCSAKYSILTHLLTYLLHGAESFLSS